MDEFVKRLRNCVDALCGECKYQQLQKPGNFVPCMNAMITEAADAIEELQATLCNWCAVCPEDKRDLSTCEIYESCRAKPSKEGT